MAIGQGVKTLRMRRFGVPRRSAPGELKPGDHPSRSEQPFTHIRPRSMTSRLSRSHLSHRPSLRSTACFPRSRKEGVEHFFFPWLLENEMFMVYVRGTSLHTLDQLINPPSSTSSAISLVTGRVGAPGGPRTAEKAGRYHSSETCTNLLPFVRANKTYW